MRNLFPLFIFIMALFIFSVSLPNDKNTIQDKTENIDYDYVSALIEPNENGKNLFLLLLN